MNKENYMVTTIIIFHSLFCTFNFIIVVRGLKTHCVSHPVNGTDDDILWENSQEENSASRDENSISDRLID